MVKDTTLQDKQAFLEYSLVSGIKYISYEKSFYDCWDGETSVYKVITHNNEYWLFCGNVPMKVYYRSDFHNCDDAYAFHLRELVRIHERKHGTAPGDMEY